MGEAKNQAFETLKCINIETNWRHLVTPHSHPGQGSSHHGGNAPHHAQPRDTNRFMDAEMKVMAERAECVDKSKKDKYAKVAVQPGPASADMHAPLPTALLFADDAIWQLREALGKCSKQMEQIRCDVAEMKQSQPSAGSQWNQHPAPW